MDAVAQTGEEDRQVTSSITETTDCDKLIKFLCGVNNENIIPSESQAVVDNEEPLSWRTIVTDMFVEFGQHIAKVEVEGSNRLCKVDPNVFQIGEEVFFVRADVDIIFTEGTTGFAAKHGVPESKKPYKIMTTKYGKIGHHEIRGNLLKCVVGTEPSTWEIRKHVSSAPIEGGNFPTELIKKTSEHNAENKPKLLKPLLHKLVDVTLKLDGQSVTLIYQKDKPLTVCTRNTILEDSNRRLKLSWFLKRFPKSFTKIFPIEGVKEEDQIFAIQAEHIGERTNGNLHGYTEDKLFVFNIVEGRRRLNRAKMLKRMEMLIPDFPLRDVDIVPLIGVETFNSLDEIHKLAEKQTYQNSGVIAEGVIIRDPNDYSKSLKIINNGYEQKKKEIRDTRLKNVKNTGRVRHL